MLFGTDLIDLLYLAPILLLSIAVHECAHAVTAHKLGDRSQRLRGRMTLDPFAHFDILGFLSIMLIGFGWGKPVQYDDANFKKPSRDNMLVSLAGPVSNLILAVIFAVIYKLLVMTNVIDLLSTNPINTIVGTMLYLSVIYNVVLAVFNMLPLPPFDGSKVLVHFLPYNKKKYVYNLEKYSLYILIILIVTGILGVILNPFVVWATYLLNLFLSL